MLHKIIDVMRYGERTDKNKIEIEFKFLLIKYLGFNL